ncbi:NAD(P)/FAD-dependent oxidoreductase [Terriglobus tenax]|uniref:NAD(P)/FAD-dependent oxidoreductase n=1 Tax=Terriglobus tenax TaxID=1111115 RepID=UPI0021DFC565|nr:FAD-dependent oxidoreductase [Terriglobus tenax]
MQRLDVAVVGAGVIGLAVALELRGRGFSVVVADKGEPAKEASWAAGGMLAVDDPENPAELWPLSAWSRELYPEFLARVEDLSDLRIPLRTHRCLQGAHEGESSLEALQLVNELGLKGDGYAWTLQTEGSLDPRDLGAALRAACDRNGIAVKTMCAVEAITRELDGWKLATSQGEIAAARVVLCTGSWSGPRQLPVFPRKGQMMAVEMEAPLDTVVRTPEIYLIPRGGNRLVIGATIEDAGYDKTVHAADIAALKMRAEKLFPPVAAARVVETWAGLRPGSPDGLPLIGALEEGLYAAMGHYRNGIQLVAATARALGLEVAGEALPQIMTAYAANRTF